MMQLVLSDRGETVIRLEGTFDRQAAAALARCLCELPGASPLVIDFSRVVSFHDAGVATVAQELAEHAGLAVRGLDRHHLRLLRYCGVELPGARADPDGEA
jgi:anti-anti-sigma regulatory factor